MDIEKLREGSKRFQLNGSRFADDDSDEQSSATSLGFRDKNENDSRSEEPSSAARETPPNGDRVPTDTTDAFRTNLSSRSKMPDLVPLNSNGSKTPFFCIAGAGSLALTLLPLARRLGPEQPFYGLQTSRIESRGFPDFTLTSTADRHSKTIQQIQPHGPYLIGGHSLGGVLAIKVAKNLAARGEEVALVVIFSTLLSGRMADVPTPRAGAEGGPSRILHLYGDRPKLSTILSLPMAGIIPLRGKKQYDVLGLHSVIQARFARQLSKWDGPTVVYASASEMDKLEYRWRNVLTGEWSRVIVPGDHVSILRQPNVNVLADDLQKQLARAISRTGDK